MEESLQLSAVSYQLVKSAPAPKRDEAAGPVAPEMLYHVAAAMALVKAFRMHGHLAAKLDPLGTPPIGDPALDPGPLGLTPEVMAAIPSKVLRIAVPGRTLAESLPHLQATYCGTMAYEIEHIATHEERVWLREKIESGAYRQPLTPEEQRRLLHRLTEVEALERFLHKAYLGQKRFSIEGVDMLVPMLDLTIERAADTGARDVVIGMAHRGRLNVLAHTVGRPYETIFAEFEGGRQVEGGQLTPEGGTGDVKYHHGAEGAYVTSQGKAITVSLSPNPSHLEFVSPGGGRPRAGQADPAPGARSASRSLRGASRWRSTAMPPSRARGSWPRRSTSARSRGTGPAGRSTSSPTTRSASPPTWRTRAPPGTPRDLAKGFDIPIIHVNADDPEACLSAVRLAMAYRERFNQDVLIDLVGYRRHGHNEGDEPAYTQPLMYERIKALPSVRELLRPRAGRGGRADAGGGRAAGRRRPTSGWWTSSRRSRRAWAKATTQEHDGPLQRARSRGGDRALARVPHRAQRAAAELARGIHGPSQAAQAAGASPDGAGSRGRHRLGPRRGAGAGFACSPKACRSASPDRTPSAAPSASGTSCCTTWRPGGPGRRSRSSPERWRRWSCTTARFRSSPRSASSTATAPRPRRRWCSGRRSSATSSTARR